MHVCIVVKVLISAFEREKFEVGSEEESKDVFFSNASGRKREKLSNKMRQNNTFRTFQS